MTKQAILMVSFGTSYPETRKKTIDAIEKQIQERFPEHPLYRAWTSSRIRRKILARDQERISGIAEAMEQMEADGITEVIVQPTHVMDGIENERMTEQIMAERGRFSQVVIGAPLLTSREDLEQTMAAVTAVFPLKEQEALVLMGHGTEHPANRVYTDLNRLCREQGYQNVFIGTVEAKPDLEWVLQQVSQKEIRRVILAPFMIVAGDHATNDLAGPDEDSWKSRFEDAGYETACVLKGLGEYPAVRGILADHVAASLEIRKKTESR
jgi:sirohydrochlorin cobaltochelatase